MQSPTEARFVPTDGESVAEVIVSAVATAEGVDPGSLRPRLYDVVDPDALESLFGPGTQTGDVTLEFEYGDWQVHVEETVVTVTEPAPTGGVT